MFDHLSSEIVKSALLIISLIVVRIISAQAVRKVMGKLDFGLQRKRLTLKVINFLLLLIAITILLGIWGLKGRDLFLFTSSVVTVIGVAFFAQWSILSNLSAGLILFFNHPLKIGDDIEIKDKELSVIGRVDDITVFFIHIITTDDERVTVPNNIVLQKTVSYKKSPRHKNDQLTKDA